MLGTPTAYNTTKLEESDRSEKSPLQWEERVNFSPKSLCRSSCNEESSAIPANILKTVELIGDGRNGR